MRSEALLIFDIIVSCKMAWFFTIIDARSLRLASIWGCLLGAAAVGLGHCQRAV